jgi:hypothetical protein
VPLLILLAMLGVLGFVPRGQAQVQAQPAVGTCLGGSCQVGAPVGPVAVPQQDLGIASRSPGFARGASWFGLFGGALSLAGSFAIAFADDPDSERITRGISFSFNALAVPVVALGSWTTRRRARVKGHQASRQLGWTAYTGAITNSGAMWYLALQNDPPSVAYTLGIGFVSLLSFLPHAFDAYVTARAARLRGVAGLSPGPGGFVYRF